MRPISRFIMPPAPHWRSSQTTESLLIGIGVLATILTVPDVARAGEDNTPTQAVKNTVSELLHIVKGQKDTSRLNQRRWDVEQVIRRHVSYDEMAKRCLGEPWTGLDDGQREEFVGLFVQMLRDALANRIFEYSDERIFYLSEQQEQDFAQVATKLWGHKVDTWVEFRLRTQAGRWLLYDAIIDGASIVSNYHAQFAAVLRELSYAGLIDKMKQRTVLVKVFEGG